MAAESADGLRAALRTYYEVAQELVYRSQACCSSKQEEAAGPTTSQKEKNELLLEATNGEEASAPSLAAPVLRCRRDAEEASRTDVSRGEEPEVLKEDDVVGEANAGQNEEKRGVEAASCASAEPTSRAAKRRRTAGDGERRGIEGFVAVCDDSTMDEALARSLIGAPASRLKELKAIGAKTVILLHNRHRGVVVGPFAAVGAAGLNLVPEAFGGRYPAQLKVQDAKQSIWKAHIVGEQNKANVPYGAASAASVRDLLRLAQPACRADKKRKRLDDTIDATSRGAVSLLSGVKVVSAVAALGRHFKGVTCVIQDDDATAGDAVAAGFESILGTTMTTTTTPTTGTTPGNDCASSSRTRTTPLARAPPLPSTQDKAETAETAAARRTRILRAFRPGDDVAVATLAELATGQKRAIGGCLVVVEPRRALFHVAATDRPLPGGKNASSSSSSSSSNKRPIFTPVARAFLAAVKAGAYGRGSPHLALVAGESYDEATNATLRHVADQLDRPFSLSDQRGEARWFAVGAPFFVPVPGSHKRKQPQQQRTGGGGNDGSNVDDNPDALLSTLTKKQRRNLRRRQQAGALAPVAPVSILAQTVSRGDVQRTHHAADHAHHAKAQLAQQAYHAQQDTQQQQQQLQQQVEQQQHVAIASSSTPPQAQVPPELRYLMQMRAMAEQQAAAMTGVAMSPPLAAPPASAAVDDTSAEQPRHVLAPHLPGAVASQNPD